MVRAAIDLGTNTFHLLIADVGDHVIHQVLWQERKYVFLAEGGVDHLSDEVAERARLAVEYFRQVLDRFEVEDIRIVGTEALRKSDNGRQLSKEFSIKLRAPIHVISGDEEALLIAKGVQMAMGTDPFDAHAIDIGGGSTEVITFNDGQVEDYTSQTCGIGYLFNRFHHNEPLSHQEHDDMRAYIKECYASYFSSVMGSHEGRKYSIIGVAGSFEVLESLSGKMRSEPSEKVVSVPFALVKNLLNDIRSLDLEQRGRIPGMPVERKKYVIEGLTIMDVILDITGIEELLISRYSIKHGLLFANF